MLMQRMRELRDYDESMRRYLARLARKAVAFEWVDGQPPTREELNERARFR
jgi:hypothetical protein